jgi:hypothetical protein
MLFKDDKSCHCVVGPPTLINTTYKCPCLICHPEHREGSSSIGKHAFIYTAFIDDD